MMWLIRLVFVMIAFSVMIRGDPATAAMSDVNNNVNKNVHDQQIVHPGMHHHHASHRGQAPKRSPRAASRAGDGSIDGIKPKDNIDAPKQSPRDPSALLSINAPKVSSYSNIPKRSPLSDRNTNRTNIHVLLFILSLILLLTCSLKGAI